MFDPAKREVVHQESIARIEPQNWRIKLVAKSPVSLDAGGEYLDGRIWFANGSHLLSYGLP